MKYQTTKSEVFKVDSKTNLPAYSWLPAGKKKAIFLAIHGGMAYAGDWQNTALFFKKHGIATYALDLRWHGHFPEYNPGQENIFHIDNYDSYVNDIHKYYEKIKNENPDIPIYILSHSNGGLIALYYGLKAGKFSEVKGYIVSSPWIVNRVKVPLLLRAAAKVLSLIYPKFEITPEPLTDVLTHDEEITARHHEDEKQGVRGKTVSAKLSIASQKAQDFVLSHIDTWGNKPVLSIFAGKDKLASTPECMEAVEKIKSPNSKMLYYADNFHENFNELNREEIYNEILNWLGNDIK